MYNSGGRIRRMYRRAPVVPARKSLLGDAFNPPIQRSVRFGPKVHTARYVAFTMAAEAEFLGEKLDPADPDEARALLVSNHRSVRGMSIERS